MGGRGQITDIRSLLAALPSLLTLIYTLVAFPIRSFFVDKIHRVPGGTPGNSWWGCVQILTLQTFVTRRPFCLRRFKKALFMHG